MNPKLRTELEANLEKTGFGSGLLRDCHRTRRDFDRLYRSLALMLEHCVSDKTLKFIMDGIRKDMPSINHLEGDRRTQSVLIAGMLAVETLHCNLRRRPLWWVERVNKHYLHYCFSDPMLRPTVKPGERGWFLHTAAQEKREE